MSKLIQLRIDIIHPDWKRSKWDFMAMSWPDYIRNEKVNKLFEEGKVLNWEIDGGYIWLEIKS